MYQFWKKSLRKNATLSSWTLFQHICPHFWVWLLNTITITPKSKDKYVVKVFNWSEVHLSEMTCYKIHTLVTCTRTQSFLQVFFTLCVTSNSLGMLLFLFKNCIFLQKPWNMYYVHILRLCKYLYNMYIFLF